jgi:AmmeMemoRadiSam system protein B/AmmeMemoRadiSam system protein A
LEPLNRSSSEYNLTRLSYSSTRVHNGRMYPVREAAVAGRFYPGEANELRQSIAELLAGAATDAPCPKALVAPHAGYIYSGPVAAQAYARVRNGAQHIRRVILLGPSHQLGFNGIATSGAECYATPLGSVVLDREAIDAVEKLPCVQRLDQAHAGEHALEVQLPFLQTCLSDFTLVPLVVGNASAEDVATVLATLWGGPETLVVVSSDLSHFLDYDHARERDAQTSKLIEARSTSIEGNQACGCRPLNGLLQLLRQRDLEIHTIALNNSGDTAGDKARVVGYGAYVVQENRTKAGIAEDNDTADLDSSLDAEHRKQLLDVAHAAIVHGLEGRGELAVSPHDYASALQQRYATFVTLHRNSRLRGCIGKLEASLTLVEDVAHNAAAAAFRDPRFQPLSRAEYPDLELHISVLSAARRVATSSREELVQILRPGVHGLILQQGPHHATYLPSVWEQLPDPEQFIGELRHKAGLPREGWSDRLQASVYTSCEFSQDCS